MSPTKEPILKRSPQHSYVTIFSKIYLDKIEREYKSERLFYSPRNISSSLSSPVKTKSIRIRDGVNGTTRSPVIGVARFLTVRTSRSCIFFFFTPKRIVRTDQRSTAPRGLCNVRDECRRRNDC